MPETHIETHGETEKAVPITIHRTHRCWECGKSISQGEWEENMGLCSGCGSEDEQ